jgi:hypothetical protein
VGDDIRIFDSERLKENLELERIVLKEIKIEKARLKGGEEEKLKVEEDYEVKKSKEKADAIL